MHPRERSQVRIYWARRYFALPYSIREVKNKYLASSQKEGRDSHLLLVEERRFHNSICYRLQFHCSLYFPFQPFQLAALTIYSTEMDTVAFDFAECRLYYETQNETTNKYLKTCGNENDYIEQSNWIEQSTAINNY